MMFYCGETPLIKHNKLPFISLSFDVWFVSSEKY